MEKPNITAALLPLITKVSAHACWLLHPPCLFASSLVESGAHNHLLKRVRTFYQLIKTQHTYYLKLFYWRRLLFFSAFSLLAVRFISKETETPFLRLQTRVALIDSIYKNTSTQRNWIRSSFILAPY